MRGRQRLLMVAPTFPVPVRSGGDARIRRMCEALAGAFDLTALLLRSGALEPEGDAWLRSVPGRILAPLRPHRRSLLRKARHRLGREWTGRIRGTHPHAHNNSVRGIRRMIRELTAEGPQAVVGIHWYLAPEELTRSPWLSVLDTHDVMYEKFAFLGEDRDRGRRRWELRREAELAAWRRYDLLAAISRHDEEVHARALGAPERVLFVPGGVALPPSHEASAEPDTLVFFGALRGKENIEAVRRLHRRHLPRIRRERPGVRLLVVGSHPPEEIRRLASADLEVTGYVPEPGPVLRRAQVALCPFLGTYGARMRLLELLALGLPVVTYPQAIQGMELGPADGVLPVEPEAFDDAVLRLLTRPEERAALAERARRAVEARFSLDATYGRMCRLLQGALERHARGEPPTWGEAS